MAQKGPFLADGSIRAQVLDARGEPVGDPIEASTDARGAFRLDAKPGQWLLLTAEGRYFDEYRVSESSGTVSLRALVLAGSRTRVNINLFTDMAAARALALVDAGADFDSALEAAHAGVARLFSLDESTDPRDLDLLDPRTAGGASLLLASQALLAVSDAETETVAGTPAKRLSPKFSLDVLTLDFADDGLLNGAGGIVYDDMILHARGANLAAIADQLSGRYTVFTPVASSPAWIDTVRISAYDTTGIEGQSLTVAVSLNGPATRQVRVSYETRNGEALGGVHYQPRSGQLVFAPGVMRQTVTVPTTKRADGERTVRFSLELSQPVNAELARPSAALTIFDRMDLVNVPRTRDFSITRFELESIERNGHPAVGPVLFDDDNDTLVAYFRLESDVACVARYAGDFRPACPERPDYIAEIFVMGDDGQRLLVGRELVPAAAVRGRGALFLGAPVHRFGMPLNVEGFASFVTARANGGMRFEVVARVADQNDELHAATTTAPRMLALDERMNFGGVATSDTRYDSVVLDSSCTVAAAAAGISGIGLRLTGTTRWRPAGDDSWSDADAGFVGLCAALVDGADGFELRVVDGNASVIQPVSTQAGGLTLSVELAQLSSEGAMPLDIRLGLPSGVSFHSADVDQQPSRDGVAFARLGSPAAVTDFRQFVPTLNHGFLVVEGLPFAVKVQGASLLGNGLRSSNSRLHYLHAAFAQDDPRRSRMRSNTAHYARAQNPASFTLGAGGLDLDSSIPAGAAQMHYPRVESLASSAREIVVRGSRMQMGPISAAQESARFGMSADCGGCGSGAAPLSYDLQSVGGIGMGADGAVAMRVQNLSEPKWGPYDAAADTHIFARLGDASVQGLFYLPGFVASGSAGQPAGRVAQYLMGAREVQDWGVAVVPESQHYRLEHAETQRGNHFTAGLTVGPEKHVGAQGLPDVGVGSDLSGTGTRVGFGGLPGPSYANVASNIGTRYVVRPAGLTGVFNSDAQPQVTAYGYALDLRRFAFRQVGNRIDTFTWIDGQVAVPEPDSISTQFRVSLSSLGLECSGDLASGIVDHEMCGDGIDDNGNGLVDENCNARLTVWRTDSRVFSAAFRPVDDGLPSCLAQARELELGHSLGVVALAQPLEGLLRWQPSGVLDTERQRIVSPAVQRLDGGGGSEGFAVALDGVAMASRSDSDYGWFRFGTQVGVPFWSAIDAEGRLVNRTPTEAEVSVLLPSLPGDHASQNNAQLGSRAASDAALALTARYEWGNTGFGFQLPVYYRPGGVSASRPPSFLGRRRGADLVVFEIGAGIDYIEPTRTKLSFGASADFDRLRSLELDLHIDLNDPASLARVDTLLARFGVRNQPVSTAVGTVRERVDLLNRIADAGLEPLIERQLRRYLELALGQAEGPTDRLAELLTEVHALPARIADELIRASREAEARVLAPLADSLDATLVEIYQDVPQQIAAAAAPQGTPDLPAIEAARERLARGRGAIQSVDQGLVDYALRLGSLPDRLNPLDDRIGDAMSVIQQVRGQLNSIQSVVQSCSLPAVPGGFGMQATSASTTLVDINASPLYGPLHELVSRLDTAVLALQAIELLSGFAQPVAQAIDIDTSAVRDAERQVREMAADLRTRVTEARNLIEDEVCGNAVVYFNGAVQPAFEVLDRIQSEIGSVQAMLDQARTQAGTMAHAIGNGLLGLRQGLQAIDAQLASMDRQLADIQAFEPQPFVTAQDLRASLDAAAMQIFDRPFVNGAGESFVRKMEADMQLMLVAMREQIPETVNRVFAPLMAVVPHYSGQDMRRMIADRIIESPPVRKLLVDANRVVSAAVEQANTLTQTAFDQVNTFIRAAAARAEARVNEALEVATAPIKAIPLHSAKVDGFAVIAGNELERAHVGASWVMPGDADDSRIGFNAALDVTSWSANDKAAGCSIGDASSRLDARISTRDFPIAIGPGDMRIRHLYLQFTVDGSLNVGSGQQGARGFVPVGIAGGIETAGTLDFQAFKLFDIGFAAGLGVSETYVGARAGGAFEDIAIEAAFLVGRTCNDEVLRALDPDIMVELPGGIFNGVYARGAASFPLFTMGCPLTVGASAEIGGWVLAGPPVSVGGLIGGGAFGRVACIGAIRGQVRATAQVLGDQVMFRGEGFGAAGVGWCEPSTWTSRERSRRDSWCGTGDAGFALEYRSGWRMLDYDVSAVH